MKVCIYSLVFLALFAVAIYAEEEEVALEILTECPAEDGEHVVHIANLDDCTKFYTCNRGEAVETSCPSGLGYNAEKQVCDWPENVGCEIPAAVEEEAESE